MRLCSLKWCNEKHWGLGYCQKHYNAAQRRGGIDKPSRLYGPLTTWSGAHKRVKRLWGPARQYPCVQCGKRATGWAYDGTDPTEVYGPVNNGTRAYGADGQPYWSYFSSYPEFYMPLCGRCHSRKDGARARDELREYRQWKYRTGLTLDEIEHLVQQYLGERAA